MNFKEMYKSANDDIKGDRELIGQIFEKAEKKSFAFPKFTFSYAVVAVVAFAFFFSIYQNFGIAPEETDKVAVTDTQTPEVSSAEKPIIKKSEDVIKESSADTEVVYVGEKVMGKDTDNITLPDATPTVTAAKEAAEESVAPEKAKEEPIRVASILNVNTVVPRRSMPEMAADNSSTYAALDAEEDSMDKASSGGASKGGAASGGSGGSASGGEAYAPPAPTPSPAPSPESDRQVTVTTSEQGGEASQILESDDYVKSQINGQNAVIIYDGSNYTAYIESGENDIKVQADGVTEEELEEILNSIE